MLEVVTPAASFDLCTVEQVNAGLGLVNYSDTDAALAGYITAASDIIARHCKRIFAAQTYRETFYTAVYRNELLLAQFPVASIDSIIEYDTTLADDTAQVNADTGALVRLVSGDPAWWPTGKIVVTYTAGFGEDTGLPSLPAAVERAAILLAGMYRNRALRDPAIRSVSAGEASVTYGLLANGVDNGLPAEIVALLQPFKDFRLR